MTVPRVITFEEIDAVMFRSCDWGGCEDESTALRWSDGHGWLPVCGSCSRSTHASKGARR